MCKHMHIATTVTGNNQNFVTRIIFHEIYADETNAYYSIMFSIVQPKSIQRHQIQSIVVNAYIVIMYF